MTDREETDREETDRDNPQPLLLNVSGERDGHCDPGRAKPAKDWPPVTISREREEGLPPVSYNPPPCTPIWPTMIETTPAPITR